MFYSMDILHEGPRSSVLNSYSLTCRTRRPLDGFHEIHLASLVCQSRRYQGLVSQKLGIEVRPRWRKLIVGFLQCSGVILVEYGLGVWHISNESSFGPCGGVAFYLAPVKSAHQISLDMMRGFVSGSEKTISP